MEAQLKEENWKTVAMPAKLYRIVGEVVFGKVFTKGTIKIIKIYRDRRWNCYQAVFS